MAAINASRVLAGGFVAGVIMNFGEYVLNEPILGEEWRAALETLNRPPMGEDAIPKFIAMTLILGIFTVWLYAAIRPRFGAGPKTAITAGLIVWVLAYLWPSLSMSVLDLFPPRLLAIGTIWGLFEVPIASVVGAWFYKED